MNIYFIHFLYLSWKSIFFFLFFFFFFFSISDCFVDSFFMIILRCKYVVINYKHLINWEC